MDPQHETQQQQSSTANANETTTTSEGGVSLSPPTFQLDDGGGGAENQRAQTTVAAQTASSSETWDPVTNGRISGIHPDIQSYAFTLVNRAQTELGIKLRVTSGMRTFQEQDDLYAKGRTAPGSVVTKARGGRSMHNYGLAIDVVEITDAGRANWNMDWAAVGALGESIGWEWGGNWTSFVDKPHFQMAHGLSTSELRSMYNAQGGNFISLDGRPAPTAAEQDQENNQTTTTPGQTTGTNTNTSPGTQQISGSVGKGGQNIYDDVIVVQKMLNGSGGNLVEDGDCGPLTILAIEAFQMAQFGWKDGRIDVNGKTWGALESNSPAQPLVHTVRRGETLSSIASQFNVSVSEILSANPSIRNANIISVGQKITIPPQGGGTVTTPADPTTSENETPGPDTNTGGNTDAAEGGQTSLIYGSQVSTEFAEKVVLISGQLGLNPNYLMAAMAFETGGSFDPAQKNFAGSGATGLIQFMPRTAIGLGTTTAALAEMSAVEQLDWVKKYFDQYTGRINTLEDLYMAILWPRGIGRDNSYVLWSRGSIQYTQNSGLDSNNDGTVTKAEAAGKVRARYDAGLEDTVIVGGGSPDTSNETETSPGGESDSNELGGGETANETETETGGGGSSPSSSNFALNEFHSKDGTPVPDEYYSNLQELMDNLEVLRAELDGNSIRVNSGYRSPAHNRSVRGKSNSLHLVAKAADIVVSGYSPGLVYETISRLIGEGKMKQGGLGRYNSFTHYDVRGYRARW